MKQTTAERLLEVARWVERNLPDRLRPEDFHSRKSEIVHELRRIAREQPPHDCQQERP